jgi:signal transduction histidine kinase
MIQRILDFSRQQSGTLTYAPAPIDVGGQLGAIADAYRPHVEARGASLHTELPEGLWVNADAAALESAVVNLLENAIKYQATESPDPRIELALTRVGNMARIDVADRGRGVPDAERNRIFDSFYRASNAGEVRGAGLGLSLVQHFAEAHGGRITALPREGGGSIFRLELPLQPST